MSSIRTGDQSLVSRRRRGRRRPDGGGDVPATAAAQTPAPPNRRAERSPRSPRLRRGGRALGAGNTSKPTNERASRSTMRDKRLCEQEEPEGGAPPISRAVLVSGARSPRGGGTSLKDGARVAGPRRGQSRRNRTLGERNRRDRHPAPGLYPQPAVGSRRARATSVYRGE